MTLVVGQQVDAAVCDAVPIIVNDDDTVTALPVSIGVVSTRAPADG